MKKIITLFVASVMLVSVNAQAQNLGGLLGSVLGAATGSTDSNSKAGNILNTISNVVYAYTGNTTAVSLPGNWNYAGSAVALGSDNQLSNIAGAAARGTIETKVDEYLQKVGLTAGAMQFTFNEDLTFTCTVKGIPVSGTWRTLDDGKKVQLQFSKTLKKLSMTGTLQQTSTGCEMLFEGKKFLNFVKTVLTYVAKQSSTASSIASLAGNYSDMKIGFKLDKIN